MAIALTAAERESTTWKKVVASCQGEREILHAKLVSYVETNRIHEAVVTAGRIRENERILKLGEAPNGE